MQYSPLIHSMRWACPKHSFNPFPSSDNMFIIILPKRQDTISILQNLNRRVVLINKSFFPILAKQVITSTLFFLAF